MFQETLPSGRGNLLRKNRDKTLKIFLDEKDKNNVFLINGTSFITENVSDADLSIEPKTCYMVINNGDTKIELNYNRDISSHEVLYDPYKFEHSEKSNFNPEEFRKHHSVPERYIDILSKWYSIKFTYPDYNLIFVKPEMGISIQIHDLRSEHWEILDGEPIIISGNSVYYHVKKGTEFHNEINMYHSVINPNKDPNDFVIIKEYWEGKFDEEDISRIFNPNNSR